MELREYIETGIKKVGSVVALAKLIGQNAANVTNAKAQRRGLPNYACVRLADLLSVERIEVIAASELVTEKNPERQKVWLPFVLAAEMRQLALDAQNAAPVAIAEMQTAPVREPSEKRVASRGIEPRTRGFSAIIKTYRLPQRRINRLSISQVMCWTQMRVSSNHRGSFPSAHFLQSVKRDAFLH